MATFNGAKYLADQLDSLLGQTHRPHELVVCDDCSSDRTPEIVLSFAREAPFPVHLHRNTVRLGASENFLQAAKLCRGEWISFCDQDDVWLPAKLQTLTEAIGRSPGVLMACHRAMVVDDDLKCTGRVIGVHTGVAEKLLQSPYHTWRCAYGFTQTFRRELTNELPTQSRAFEPHDQWTFLLACAIGQVLLLPDVLALYRRHENNVSVLPHETEVLNRLPTRGIHDHFGSAAVAMKRMEVYLTREAPQRSKAVALYRSLHRALRARAAINDPASDWITRTLTWSSGLIGGSYIGRGRLGFRALMADAARVVRK